MTKVNITVGPGFFALLTLLFIGLKLGHVIDWSWWWVLGPIWIPSAVLLAIFGLVFLAAWILAIRDTFKKNREHRKIIQDAQALVKRKLKEYERRNDV